MRRVTRDARAVRCVRVRWASYIAWSACSISAFTSVPSSGSIAMPTLTPSRSACPSNSNGSPARERVVRRAQVAFVRFVAGRVEHRGGDQVGHQPQRARIGRRHHLQHADRRADMRERHHEHRAQADPAARIAIDARAGFRIAAVQQLALLHTQAPTGCPSRNRSANIPAAMPDAARYTMSSPSANSTAAALAPVSCGTC